MKLLGAAVVVLILALLVGRAWDYEQARYGKLSERVVELEVHDCGLRQEEDLSISLQRDDRKRFMCASLMRGEIVCTKVVEGGQLYYATCHKP